MTTTEQILREASPAQRLEIEAALLDGRNGTIKAIRAALKKRSGLTWSVTGGTGTAWGWIHISAPPKRRDRFGQMSDADAATLAMLLNEPRVGGMILVAAQSDHRRVMIEKAMGVRVTEGWAPYWD